MNGPHATARAPIAAEDNGPHVIGSIYQLQGGPSDGQWKWSVTDIRLGAARPGTFGTVSSLDEAKEQLAIAWRKRIAEEGLSEV
jgi:hypothetical protein